jgi:PPOX class probable F420-dependent enzyme
MSAMLTPDHVRLLKEPHLAQFVTLMRDGSPHIAPLWVDTDGTHVVINTEEGRVKVRNMRRDPRVAISVYDPAKPYARVLNVQGRVVEITAEGAAGHIDFLAEKYTGNRPYRAHNPDRSRLIVKILPEKIHGRW